MMMLYVLFVAMVFGQENNREIKYQNRTEIDFEAIDITGEMIKPQGALVVERSGARFNPLIELRLDWNVEMNQSVDYIK